MSTLSFGRALRNAIEAEKASQRFYTLLAESTEDREARRFLKQMAKEEETHQRQLEEVVLDCVDVDIPNLPDDNVELIETMPEWADVDNIDYESALRVALEAERHASLYYDAIADALTVAADREIFRQIARTEDQHAENLEQLMK